MDNLDQIEKALELLLTQAQQTNFQRLGPDRSQYVGMQPQPPQPQTVDSTVKHLFFTTELMLHVPIGCDSNEADEAVMELVSAIDSLMYAMSKGTAVLFEDSIAMEECFMPESCD